MEEIETQEYRTFYSNHVICTASDHEAILRFIRSEPCKYQDGVPQALQLLVESQVVMNIHVLEERHRTITTALNNLKQPLKKAAH